MAIYDVTTTVAGAAEMTGSAAMGGASLALDSTGVLAPAGIAMGALAAAGAAHGSGMAMKSAGNLGDHAKDLVQMSKGEGTGNVPTNFADRAKLESHFDKHGGEFGGTYKNEDEYLDGAKDVINNGIKVQYEYKGETRTGYVRFMRNNKDGNAKFEFVGTNNNGEITTYHTQSSKKFWKTINGENVPVINPAK